MKRLRSWMAVAAAGLLQLLPEAVHAQAPHPAPQPVLKPGHSAGVHLAQQTHTGIALIGAGVVIAVVIVAASTTSGSGNNQTNPQFAPVSTTP